MPYLEIRGERQTGKTSAGLLYAAQHNLLYIVPMYDMVRRMKARKECQDVRVVSCRTVRDLYVAALGAGVKGIVVDEAQSLTPRGKSVQEDLAEFAKLTGMWVVAIISV